MQYRIKTITKKCNGIIQIHYIIQYKTRLLWFYVWKDFVTPEVVFISTDNDITYGMAKISYKYKWYWDKDKLLKYVNELNTLPDNIVLTENNYYIDTNSQITINGYIFANIINKQLN